MDKGKGAGIHQGMAVITPRGVVGKVVSVEEDTAKVMLLTDHKSGLDIITQRTRVRGIVSGSVDGEPVVKYMGRNEDVRPGDRLITSGLDGTFPKGLLVGTIVEIAEDGPGLFRRVRGVAGRGPAGNGRSALHLRRTQTGGFVGRDAGQGTSAVGYSMNVSLAFFGIGLVFVVLQSTVLHLASWTPIIPDLTLILCVYWALNRPRVEAVWATFLLGYAIDILSSPQPGVNALAFTAVFLVVYVVFRYVWATGALISAVTVFMAVWLKVGTLIVISPLFELTARGWVVVADAILREAIFSACIAPVLFLMLRSIQNRMETVRKPSSLVDAAS